MVEPAITIYVVCAMDQDSILMDVVETCVKIATVYVVVPPLIKVAVAFAVLHLDAIIDADQQMLSINVAFVVDLA